MGKHSSERGFNASTGAYNYEGVPNSPTVNNTEHIWWVEFESLSGNYWLNRLSCDPVYLVEYAHSRSLSPALVAEYQTQLPDKELPQPKLHELFALAETDTA